MYTGASQKRTVFCISAVLFSGLLTLLVNFLISGFAGSLLISLFGRDWLTNEWQWMLAEIVFYLLMLFVPGCFLLIVFRKSPLSPFSGPLATPRLPFLYIPLAIGSLYLLNFVIAMLFGELLEPFDTPITADSFPHTPTGVLLYFLLVSILPAVFEEWLFRGIMQKNLIPAVGNWPAILLSAFVFGLMHLDPGQSIFAFGFGIFAGYVFKQTGSIWFCALIHMLNNAISVGVSYWSYVFENQTVIMFVNIFTIILMVFGGITLPIYIRYVKRKQKIGRMSAAERALPSGFTVFRLTVYNPLTYLLIAGYSALLWMLYFL